MVGWRWGHVQRCDVKDVWRYCYTGECSRHACVHIEGELIDRCVLGVGGEWGSLCNPSVGEDLARALCVEAINISVPRRASVDQSLTAGLSCCGNY